MVVTKEKLGMERERSLLQDVVSHTKHCLEEESMMMKAH